MENNDDFLQQIYSFAVVVRASPEKIQHLKELLVEEKFKVVYQKTSLAMLRIVEGTNNEQQ
jgi:hypothetical protein